MPLAQLSCFVFDWEIALKLHFRQRDGASATAGKRACLTARDFLDEVRTTSQALGDAAATVDGTLHSPASPISTLPGAGTVDMPHEVRYFLQSPSQPLSGGVLHERETTARLHGTLHGRAFAGPKDSVAWALNALAEDLVSSLEARLKLVVEEAQEEEDGEAETGESGFPVDGPTSWPLPRRAHVDTGDGFSLCDYMSSGEGVSESAERLLELAGLQLPELPDSGLEELFGPEAIADASQPLEAADAGHQIPARQSDAAPGVSKPAGKGQGGPAMAVGLAVVAAVVAFAAAFFSRAHAQEEVAAATIVTVSDSDPLPTE